MRVYPLETPVELPSVENKEREAMAWLEGWLSGMALGGVLGAAGIYIILSLIGKV